MKIHFYGNAQKGDVAARRAPLANEAARLGLQEVPSHEADIVIALGGDGTILRAVHEFPSTPILGLNFGGLGYLSAVGGEEAARALSLLAEGRYSISPRTRIEAHRLSDGLLVGSALNDIAIVRGLTGHAALLDLSIDGHLVTRYMADGLVVATPTGSTAYSLAAGGPVVMPDSPSLVVTPMNPHALGVRPLVVRDAVRLVVRVVARTDGNEVCVGVATDGRNVLTLKPGEGVEIATSEQTASLVTLEGHDPYDILARKLGWNGNLVSGGARS